MFLRAGRLGASDAACACELALGRAGGLGGAKTEEEEEVGLCSEGRSGEAVLRGRVGVGVEGRMTVDPVVAVEREEDEEREPGELDAGEVPPFILWSSRMLSSLKLRVPMPTRLRLFLGGLWVALDLLFGLLWVGEGLSGAVVVVAVLVDVGSLEAVPWLILTSGDNGSVAALFRTLLLVGVVVVVIDVSEIVESEWPEEKPAEL